ncbi:MAG: DUF3108 domain-containing protein [Acidobacteriota bacterium]
MSERTREAATTVNKHRHISKTVVAALLSIVVLCGMWTAELSAQTVTAGQGTSTFRVGEKLSYNISFGKFQNAGYAELDVVSRGKISGLDAVEIHSKLKTLDIVSAAFYLFDESRVVYAAPDTGLPLYVKTDSHDTAVPKETVTNYLATGSSSFDLTTLIYRARAAGGVGTFTLYEGGKLYTATFQQTGKVTARTEAGNFESTISKVQSDFLAAQGIKEMFVHFSMDETHVPVVIRFTTAKGEFKAVLSSIVQPSPETVVITPTPTPVPTPVTRPTSRPTPMPPTYVENVPLAPELGFEIGESLDYRVSAGGKPVATITLGARERKLFQSQDSLLLMATVTGVEQGITAFRPGDAARVQVDPETLAPKWAETRFTSNFKGLNQTLTFDKRTGNVTFGGPQPIDSPVGTHTLLSLLYAMRSFNLKPSKNLTNPVNDTRVAVFWDSRAYVFTLRPSNPDTITLNGEKVAAQLITVTTGNPQLDALALKVWLGTDDRVPLRFSFGPYQADLITQPTPR